MIVLGQFNFGGRPSTVLSMTIVGPRGYTENPTSWCYAEWNVTFLVGTVVVSQTLMGNRRVRVLEDDA